jgi:prevent-host-death family protein
MIWSRSNEGYTMHLQSIGSYETKTHLADLLRRVREGQGFTITQRGEPVADLVPAGTSVRRAGTLAAARMRALMHEAPPLEALDLKTLMEAGRD